MDESGSPHTAQRRAIGARLRSERERLQLTQQQLARLVDAPRQALVRYESGERSPRADLLNELYGHGFDVHYVVTGECRGGLDTQQRDQLELAMSTVVVLCRRSGALVADLQKLRLAFAVVESMQQGLAHASDASEAMSMLAEMAVGLGIGNWPDGLSAKPSHVDTAG